MIFNGIKPSVAISLVCIPGAINDKEVVVSSIAQQARALAKSFKNPVIILFGNRPESPTYEIFNELQLSLVDNVRLMRTSTLETAGPVIQQIYQRMHDTEKLSSMRQYFHVQRVKSASSNVARGIADQLISDAGIDRDDAKLLVEGLGSLCRLLSADQKLLEENLPISDLSIQRLLTVWRR